MHDRGKSDSPVVPAKPPNNATVVAAEAVEGRGLAKGNTASKTRPGHSAGIDAPSALDRVRRVARQDKDARFTALLHHVGVERLRDLLGGQRVWALHLEWARMNSQCIRLAASEPAVARAAC